MLRLPDLYEFESYYHDELLYQLKKVDKLRKQILINYIIIGIVVFTGFMAEAVTWMSLGIAFIILFVLFYTNIFGVKFSFFEQQHQVTLASGISGFILPGCRFDAQRYIRLKDMQDALIITGAPQQYGGRNLIEANVENIDLQISEIASFSNLRDANSRAVRHTYFTGLAAMAYYNTQLKNRIIIISESELNSNIQSLNEQFVKNKENEFIAFYKDEIEYLKYITPNIWLKLKNYCDASDKTIILSIYENGISAGIRTQVRKNYINSNLFKSVADYAEAKNYFNDLLFLTEIVLSIKNSGYSQSEIIY